ncbi:DEAD/DEAH box helicase, partial [Pseudomonas oryzihabitans]
QGAGQGKPSNKGDQAAAQPQGERKGRTRNRRNRRDRDDVGQDKAAAQPGQAVAQQPRNRDPEEFLDDDYDNFGNSVDYVSPYQSKGRNGQRRGNSGNGTRPAAAAGNGQPRQSQGQGAGAARGPRGQQQQQPGKRRGQNGQPRAARPYEAAPNEARSYAAEERAPSKPQPKIVHKPSRADRLPTLEQLEELPSRPRSEKPALLTRNREA